MTRAHGLGDSVPSDWPNLVRPQGSCQLHARARRMPAVVIMGDVGSKTTCVRGRGLNRATTGGCPYGRPPRAGRGLNRATTGVAPTLYTVLLVTLPKSDPRTRAMLDWGSACGKVSGTFSTSVTTLSRAKPDLRIPAPRWRAACLLVNASQRGWAERKGPRRDRRVSCETLHQSGAGWPDSEIAMAPAAMAFRA